jgi:hypothetical protein
MIGGCTGRDTIGLSQGSNGPHAQAFVGENPSRRLTLGVSCVFSRPCLRKPTELACFPTGCFAGYRLEVSVRHRRLLIYGQLRVLEQSRLVWAMPEKHSIRGARQGDGITSPFPRSVLLPTQTHSCDASTNGSFSTATRPALLGCILLPRFPGALGPLPFG